MFCKEQAAQLCGFKQDIEAAGATLAFIGNGNPRFARDFKASFAPECTVLTDPSIASYALLGAGQGIWATLSPRSWPAGIRAMLLGFRQTRTRGHAYLLGGVAVVDTAGAVRWRYLSRFAGDHPASAQILEAVRGLGKDGMSSTQGRS